MFGQILGLIRPIYDYGIMENTGSYCYTFYENT